MLRLVPMEGLLRQGIVVGMSILGWETEELVTQVSGY